MRRAANAARDAGADPVLVILGADADLIAPTLNAMDNVRCITNPEWKSGLSSSLSCGLHAVLTETKTEAALVTLADQAFVDGAALASLIAAFDDDHRLVASSYDGVIGVPALFAHEYLEELTALTGDAGAGAWLRAREELVTRIPLEKAALDIDNPSDTALLQ